MGCVRASGAPGSSRTRMQQETTRVLAFFFFREIEVASQQHKNTPKNANT